MGTNGKAGHGHGNNRKRPFRRRENDGEGWQKGTHSGWEPNRPSVGKRPETGSEHGRTSGRPTESHGNRNHAHKKNADRFERPPHFERPKWTQPKIKTEPLPVSDCAWCGKPIKDISSAIADKDSGAPVHFDCVISRITFGERLEKGESVTYIGGGRFGIISFDNPARHHKDAQAKSPGNFQNTGGQDPDRRSTASSSASSDFTIKKIIEWEDKDKRAEWRSVICDHYSVT